MELNDTPVANRIHIGFFGRRNAGKSSLVNAVAGQTVSVVSDVAGTTTDPVKKTMELLPLGPVVLIDTPGYDDEGSLGEMRVARTKQILNRTDLAVLAVDGSVGMTACDYELLDIFRAKDIPFLIAFDKADLAQAEIPADLTDAAVRVSAASGAGLHAFKERLAHLRPAEAARPLVADLVQPGDVVVLVIPIDEAAPKGRLILPQQQVLRELLEVGAMAICTRACELAATLAALRADPALVVTDSQAFAEVAPIVPERVPLTSFSILMARYKGFLRDAVGALDALDRLRDGDRILIAEGCTHHRQCNDIGTVKIPRLLRAKTGKTLVIETSSGLSFPEDLSPYALVIHCGGCMLNEREVRYRQKCARDAGVPFTNYGTFLAAATGILARSLRCVPLGE